MAQSCSIYGLGLHVNVPLAALAGMPAPPRVDVRMAVGAEPAHAVDDGSWEDYYASPERDSRGVHHIRVARRTRPDGFRVTYEDGTRIYVDGAGDRVWAIGPPGATTEDTATYLLGPTLGFVLRLRGTICLHGSAVDIDGRAVAIVAPSGFGKSTTAAAFAMRGNAILTDDVVALEDQGTEFAVRAAYPRIRLWPSSVRSLFGSEDALPRITPTWEKRFLPLDGATYRFQPRALPLAAIYFLADREPGVERPRVEPLEGRDALMALVGNTYTNYLLDKPMRAREFDVIARLARHVPIRRAVPSERFEGLDALCSLIEDGVGL